MRRNTALLILFIAAGSSAATAQTVTGGASLNVQRSLSIASARPIRLSEDGATSLSIAGDIRPDAPALIRVSGDPGRVYRIRVPRSAAIAAGDGVIENLRILSVNAGDVSTSGLARMDSEGHDLLQISGRLRPPNQDQADAPAALPLSIDYE